MQNQHQSYSATMQFLLYVCAKNNSFFANLYVQNTYSAIIIFTYFYRDIPTHNILDDCNIYQNTCVHPNHSYYITQLLTNNSAQYDMCI